MAMDSLSVCRFAATKATSFPRAVFSGVKKLILGSLTKNLPGDMHKAKHSSLQCVCGSTSKNPFLGNPPFCLVHFERESGGRGGIRVLTHSHDTPQNWVDPAPCPDSDSTCDHGAASSACCGRRLRGWRIASRERCRAGRRAAPPDWPKGAPQSTGLLFPKLDCICCVGEC